MQESKKKYNDNVHRGACTSSVAVTQWSSVHTCDITLKFEHYANLKKLSSEFPPHTSGYFQSHQQSIEENKHVMLLLSRFQRLTKLAKE